jgi:hypothetical protein
MQRHCNFLEVSRYSNMRPVIFTFFLLVSGILKAQCDSVPTLNKAVLAFTLSKMNKKVGRGECWDLAKYALEEVGADWDGAYGFGRKLEKGECVSPGDIIQFERIRIKYKKGSQTHTEAMPHHTAIIFEVISSDEVKLAHQNTGYTGRKVGVSGLKFSTIQSGKYAIYRPQN